MNTRSPRTQGSTGKSRPWQFMSKFTITSADGDPYLVRWRLIQTPLFGIYLHKFLRGDSDPYVHDHPWAFVSFILRGGYVEVRRDNFTHNLHLRHIKRINVMRRDDAHYVDALDRVPTWSLVFVGRRRRTWGFWKPKSLWDTPMQEIPDQTWVQFENWESR